MEGTGGRYTGESVSPNITGMFLLVFQLFQQDVNMVLGGKMVWARAIRGFRLPLADRFAPLLSLTRGT